MKAIIKRFVRSFGLDIRKYNVENSDIAKLIKMLKFNKIDHVLDIGASDGVSGTMLRNYGYQGRITSFEPLSAAHFKLIESSKNDPLWTVAPRMALGESDRESVINISGSSTSSSILQILPRHLKSTPHAAYQGQETISLRKLDSVWESQVHNDSKSVFLKVDVQGYEDKVLQGASNSIAKIRGLQIELSVIPLYEGQLLFDDLYQQIRRFGFELHGLFPVYIDSESGRTLQFDAVFFK